jgi:hypothetical protein
LKRHRRLPAVVWRDTRDHVCASRRRKRTSERVAADENFGVEGHGLLALSEAEGSRAKKSRASARYVSFTLRRAEGRSLICAKYSPFTNHDSQVTNHAVLIGTLIGTCERLGSRVTHTKQTTATHPNRYTARRVLRLLSSCCTRASRPPLLSTGQHSLLTSHWLLPGTANRVKTHVSHRREKVTTGSTQDSSRGATLRDPSAVPSSSRASNPQLPASRTLACIRAAGVTSVPQRDRPLALICNALGATPTATNWPSGTSLGGGCYEST